MIRRRAADVGAARSRSGSSPEPEGEPPGAGVGATRSRSGSRPEPSGSRPEPEWESPEPVWEGPNNTDGGKVDMEEKVAEVSRWVPNGCSANETAGNFQVLGGSHRLGKLEGPGMSTEFNR